MKFTFHWGIIFLVSIVVRLPYLLGEHVYFDGDEAIVGIMAQDFLRGDGIPIYFYGQQYGFSFFEMLSTSICMLFLGNGLLSLKLGGLLLFSLGLNFVLETCKNLLVKPWVRWLFIVILSVFPIWFLWATKVRGGYITAFVALSIVVYILSRSKFFWKEICLLSLFMAIAAVSQIIIVLPFVFYIGYIFWYKLHIHSKFWKKAGIFILLLCVFYLLLRLPAYGNGETWSVTPKMLFRLQAITAFLQSFPNAFMGYFYYTKLFTMPIVVWIIFIFHVLFFVGLFFSRILKGNRHEKVILLTGIIGIFVSIIAAFLIDIEGYRYLIGASTGFVVMYMFMLYNVIIEDNTFIQIKAVVLTAIFIVPIFAYKNIPSFWQAPEMNDMQAFKMLNHHLLENNITGIFCTDPLLAWQLNYYGLSTCAARYLFLQDRVPTFIQRVNDCYVDSTCHTAFVGIYGNALGMDAVDGWHSSVEYIGERFYIQPVVKTEFLQQAGFEIQK